MDTDKLRDLADQIDDTMAEVGVDPHVTLVVHESEFDDFCEVIEFDVDVIDETDNLKQVRIYLR